MDTVIEVVASSKYQDVRLGGVVGITGSDKVGVLVYQQPKDSVFDFVAVTIAKETKRKLKNRRYRLKRSERRIIVGDIEGDGVGSNNRSGRVKST